jgi:hypothetical protein
MVQAYHRRSGILVLGLRQGQRLREQLTSVLRQILVWLEIRYELDAQHKQETCVYLSVESIILKLATSLCILYFTHHSTVNPSPETTYKALYCPSTMHPKS